MNAKLEAREPVARYLATPPLLQHFDRVAQAPGGVARLRELILTLAVQGKLVPQDPADEPASVLLERIRAEKARLVKEGKIRKEKTLAVITDEEKPFALPVGWEWVRLGDIFILEYGASLPEKNRVSGPFPVYGSNGIVGTNNQPLISEPSLVIGRKGSVGAVNIAEKPFWPIDTSYFVTPPAGVTLRYAYHLFSSLKLGKHDKATAIPGINRSDVYREIVALPPSLEQSRIVARVEELMALCDALAETGRLEAAQHERLAGALFDALANSTSAQEAADNWQRIAAHFDLLLDRPAAVDRLEQAILQLAVRGRLVPQNPVDEPASALLQKIRTEKDRLIANGQLRRDKPLPPISDEEKPFELPEGWEWVRFREVFDGGSGTTPLRAKTHFFEDGTEMWVKTTDLNNAIVTTCEELITKTAVIENRLNYYPAGSVCIAMYGGSGTIGKSGILGVASTINQSVFALPPTKGIDSHFVHIYVITIRNKWMGFAAGLRKDPNINGQIIKNMLFPLPPLAEQSRIVARVAELRALCAQLRDRLATTAQTRSRLAEALLEQAVA
ncbi:MAG TPA: restriction endonuclease subunit S [Azonexus sp.]|nr:restriction endonuclease subunit S [Azonexus sp.]